MSARETSTSLDPIHLIDPKGLEALVIGDDLSGKSCAGPGELAFAAGLTLSPLLIPLLVEDGVVTLLVLSGKYGLNTVKQGAKASYQALFGRGGLLNSNRYLRIGVGRGPGGRKVFRISGNVVSKVTRSGHIDLKDLGPL